jgi:hypothetical protein
MQRMIVSATKLALAGLFCFLAVVACTVILGWLELRSAMEKAPSGVSVVVNTPWVSLSALLGLAGLALFAGVSLFILGRIILRRFTHR